MRGPDSGIEEMKRNDSPENEKMGVKTMARTVRTKRWAAILGAVLIAVSLGCSSEEEGGGGPPRGPGGPGGFGGGNVTVSVETVEAERGAFQVHGHYAGEFQSDGMARVSAEAAGRITAVNVNIGDEVEEGEVLATVDDTSLRQSVRELEATVRVGRASLEEARVNLSNLESDLRRRRPLLERQMVTEREIEELESGILRAEQQIAVAQATIEQNEARLNTARENLRNTQIRAPFSGVVGERYVDRGSFVSPGQDVFHIIDGGDIYVTVRIPERDAPRVNRDTPVGIRIGAMGSAPLKGRIHRIAPAMDPSTRSLRVDVVLEEAEELRIRPGMYARLELELGDVDDAVTVNNQAILRRTDGTPYVWKVVEGEAQRQELVLGLVSRDRSQVIEGLNAGDVVVFRGHEKLNEGTTVRDIGVSREAGN